MIDGINGYVAAGYALIWGAIVVYAWRTRRRLRAAERALAGSAPRAGADGGDAREPTGTESR